MMAQVLTIAYKYNYTIYVLPNVIIDEYFKNYIHCTGQERNIMDCRFTSVEDNDCTKTPVTGFLLKFKVSGTVY